MPNAVSPNSTVTYDFKQNYSNCQLIDQLSTDFYTNQSTNYVVAGCQRDLLIYNVYLESTIRQFLNSSIRNIKGLHVSSQNLLALLLDDYFLYSKKYVADLFCPFTFEFLLVASHVLTDFSSTCRISPSLLLCESDALRFYIKTTLSSPRLSAQSVELG